MNQARRALHYPTRPPWAASHRRYLHLFATVTHRQTYQHFTAAHCRSHDLQLFSRAAERSKRLYDVHGDHTVMSAYIPLQPCFGFLLFLPLQCSVFSNLYKVMKHVTQSHTNGVYIFHHDRNVDFVLTMYLHVFSLYIFCLKNWTLPWTQKKYINNTQKNHNHTQTHTNTQ